jgi:hypothetical protein
MSRKYYRLLYRLDGATQFLLWYTNDRDGVVTTADGRVPSFGTEASLSSYASRASLDVEAEEPVLHDLDPIRAWVADPRADTLECAVLLSAWNLFGDIARSLPDPGRAFATIDGTLGALYNRLFWGNNLPAVTPEGQHFTPQWANAEVQELAELLREGLSLFVRLRREAV